MHHQNYAKHLIDLIEKVSTTQNEAILKGAEAMANAIANNRAVFAFGASHAGMLSMELFYRTGGLVVVNPIFARDLMPDIRPATLTSDVERLADYGKLICRQSPLQAGDVVIVHSVSGRNTVPIDLALEAKEMGVKVIVITNLAYTELVTSRHSSGKKLKDCGDIVIDNRGEFEDSSITLPGFEQKMGPTSTVTGAYIVNAMAMECASLLHERGIEVPIFHSANIDGGDEHNHAMLEKYKDRIHYMK